MAPFRLLLSSILALAVGFAPTAVARAASSKTDCYGAWRTAAPNRGAIGLDCEDGDYACDIDGTANGECTIGAAVCLHLNDVPRCAPASVLDVDVRAEPRRVARGLRVTLPRPPALPVSAATCGDDTVITLPLRRSRKGETRPSRRVTLRLVTTVRATPARDRDRVDLRCVPNRGVGQCGANPMGGPNLLRLVAASIGGDLDNGWTGEFHGFPIVSNATLQVCLAGCDADRNPECVQNDADTEEANPEAFGAPLALLAANTPICIRNRFGTPKLSGFMANAASGEITGTVNLLSDVYLTSVTQVCPRCSGAVPGALGICDAGPRSGHACITAGLVAVQDATGNRTYALSPDCPPSGTPLGTLAISLPLTTGRSRLDGPRPCGAASDDACRGGTCSARCAGAACVTETSGRCVDGKGGVNQLCCSDDPQRPCFATATGVPIVREGSAVAPAPPFGDASYPKTGGATLVATFCEAATGSAAVNTTAGLPGPAALVLPMATEWRR